MLLEPRARGRAHFHRRRVPERLWKDNSRCSCRRQSSRVWKLANIADDIAWISRSGDDAVCLYAAQLRIYSDSLSSRRNELTPPQRTLPAIAEHARARLISPTSRHAGQGRWWEGMDGPDNDQRWRGKPWKRGSKSGRTSEQPLHGAVENNPVRFFALPAKDPRGAPISRDPLRGAAARRRCPLAVESFNWKHGVYLDCREPRAPRRRRRFRVRSVASARDPMAMLAFIGYDAVHVLRAHGFVFGL